MASKLKLIDLSSPNDGEVNRKRERPIDWSLCILCQEVKNEILINPSQNKRLKPDKTEEGFETLHRNLKKFDQLGKVPCTVPLSLLDSGPGIKENLQQNNAQYHKLCFLKYTNSKLLKAEKSCKENISPPMPSLPTRRSIGQNVSQNISEPVCISCGKVGSRGSPLQRVLEKGAAALSTQAVNKSDTKVLVSLQDKKVWCHKKCRAAYTYQYNPDVKHTRTSSTQVHDESLQKVVERIKTVKEDVAETPLFKMAEISRLYSAELEEHGISTPAHSSRLKEKLLEECPFLEASGSPGQASLVRYKIDVDMLLREESSKKTEWQKYFTEGD